MELHLSYFVDVEEFVCIVVEWRKGFFEFRDVNIVTGYFDGCRGVDGCECSAGAFRRDDLESGSLSLFSHFSC